jgi:hypothetical protein
MSNVLDHWAANHHLSNDAVKMAERENMTIGFCLATYQLLNGVFVIN